MTREELIAALERADGASFKLDYEIAKLVFGDRVAAARYTASIDAALTLLPEGARISQMGEWDHPILRSNGPWYCIITRQDAERLEDTFLTRCQNGPTPAIALCIASLKARA